MSLAYQAITGAMAKVGNSELAWVAAERGIVGGKQSGNATVLAAAERMYAHALLAQGRNAQAQAVALSAATTLDSRDTTALGVYGALMLSTGIAAARRNDMSAMDYINEAHRVAEHLGGDHSHMFTAFGITNVAIHRVSVSVELGEGGVAVEHAARVNPRGLPAERHAQFLIDVAQSHEDHEAALQALLEAEQVAPEEIRYNPAARMLISSLLRERPAEPLQALAERIGIDRTESS